MRVVIALATLAAATALGVSAAPAGGSSDPGVSADKVVLGGTAPLSGVAAAYASVARGAAAYFGYVNAAGGVAGRQVEYRYLDDAYNPAQTVQATRQLVEQDRVFAIFNALGTEHNEAIREYLNANKVPQLFSATGATTFGADAARYPYTIGFQPSYQAEAWVLGRYLARTASGRKIAVLFQNDSYGKELLAGLKVGLQRSKVKVVAAQPYEATAADVAGQIAKLKSSGADVLAVFATPKFAIQAIVIANKLGWKPKATIMNAVASASNIMILASEGNTNPLVEGAVSIVFLKDPTDPQWTKDKAMVLYRQIMAQHAAGANANDVYHVYGMAVAWATVEALKKVGTDLTRERLVQTVSTMKLTGNPFLLPGIALETNGTADHFPIEQMLLQRWSKGSWKSFGGLWSYRAP
ncbi:MAG: branched-chain amino acid ABC transporter substrate-binding protein [Thermoleophilia bacterium]|nr:branched-chain amino acid ABC transporter substrate-binding protein [Thermoleophilia bacterium]